MNSLVDSFTAFNINGISNLVYVLMSNWWFLLIMAAAIACMIMYLKDEITVTVKEEQNVL